MNRDRARAAAAALLKEVAAPPGATALTSPPKELQQPQSEPSATSLVDEWRAWKVPGSVEDTTSWLHQHRPLTLVQSGTSSSSGPDYQVSAEFYDAPDRAGVTSIQLQIAVEGVADGTAIRADALAVWLDPVPYKEPSGGPRVRVVTTCPPALGSASSVRNDGADLAGSLLPHERPTGGLVCNYRGSNAQPPFSLARQIRLHRAAAVGLAAAINGIDLSHPDGETSSCPADFGKTTIFAFSYPDRPAVDLWHARTGCESVSNGVIFANAIGRPNDFSALSLAERGLAPHAT